jgi:hypothetical protein
LTDTAHWGYRTIRITEGQGKASNVDEVEGEGEGPEDDRRVSGSQGKRLHKSQANII